MPLLVAPALVAAGLLALAGAQKVLDPTMTVGALRALGLPSTPAFVRLGASAELGLAVVAIVAGGPVLWLLIGASYVAFAAFVAAALRKGTAIGSCGCFGRTETAPRPLHVALDLALAAVAGASVSLAHPPLDELADHPGAAVVVAAVAGGAIAVVYRAFVRAPGRRAPAASGRPS